MRKRVHHSLRASRNDYINNTLGTALKDNPKVFWSYVKSLRREDMGVADLENNGQIVSESKAKADILNNQFASVFTSESSGDLPDLGDSPYKQIAPLIISNDGVVKQLKNLKANKAQGPDEIPPWFLKMTAVHISPFLTDIFQTSIDTGKIPSLWKEANITPVFKKGKRSDASNYRPVSLTVVICKVLEHIVSSHIMKHADENSILSNNQHGFRQKRSTETQLLLTVNDIAKDLDQGNLVDAAVLDFTKAFDRVPHRRLIHKLQYYGMSGQIANWVQDFLTDRSQKVIIDGCVSQSAPVLSGVPQGTVFGPIGFLFYVNDIADRLSSRVRLFADDCLLYTPVDRDTPSEHLQADLQKLEEWQDTWLMTFNPKKCVTMTIGMKNPPHHIYNFCGEALESVDSHPYLGVLFNNTLTWGDHVLETCKKAQRVLGLLRRNLWGCSQEIKVRAYSTLVKPVLEYASVVWDSKNQTNASRLERVQKQAARFCTSEYSSREEGTMTKILSQLDWKSLELRRKMQRITMLYKITNQLVDIKADDHLKRNTRSGRGHKQKYTQIRYNTRRYGDTFFPATIPDWNSLPEATVDAATITRFKGAIHNHN